jgi:hypothetical protein
MADAEHTTLVIEGADHGGYVVKHSGGVIERYSLLFAGSLDECLGFIRKSIRKVEAPKSPPDLTFFNSKYNEWHP